MMATFFGGYSESELKAAMSRAIVEAVNLGRLGLRGKYGFGPARKFVAVTSGHHFDSKALVAAAAAHLSPSIELTSENSTGGTATTPILDACEVPWIDTDRLTNVPGLPSLSEQDWFDGSRRKYWWVNQSNNYTTAIEQGSLWAADLRSDGRPGHEDWQSLHLMQPGDVVFHYASQQFQALSLIVSAGVKADRPPGYLPTDGYQRGTLVLLEPQVIDMEVGLDTIKPLFGPGVGPMNSTGNPGRVYTAPVPRSIGEPLATYLSGGSLTAEPLKKPWESGPGERSQTPRTVDSTDIIGTALRRAEQRYLRRTLLDSFGSQCAICGRTLPENLLVAAHIKLRSESSEEERLDFEAAAMLACSLGCDTLFELGYIVVDDSGLVRRTSTHNPELRPVLQALEGRHCLAFSEATMKNFAFHRTRHDKSGGR